VKEENMIARLADKLLQRILPATEAGACRRDECYCARVGSACRYIYTNCAGTQCNYVGPSCPAC
jgi:hypothetical protein